MTSPLLYGPYIFISKLALTDGTTQGEMQFLLTAASTFSEPRLQTDFWDTTSDGLYIITSVKTNGATNGDFSKDYY
jgi:hypothetical protein